MKNVMRNNLWMMIIAWCLELNGHSIIGIVVAISVSVYLFLKMNNCNFIKTFSVCLIIYSFTYLISLVTVMDMYKNFSLFLLMNSINVAVSNEFLQKVRLRSLYNIFVISLASYICFMLVSFLIPGTLILEYSRINIMSLNTVIFVPYVTSQLIKLIEKEYRKKQLLDEIEYRNKLRAFDIKA